jgi:hypothetical protein
MACLLRAYPVLTPCLLRSPPLDSSCVIIVVGEHVGPTRRSSIGDRVAVSDGVAVRGHDFHDVVRAERVLPSEAAWQPCALLRVTMPRPT